ncbi:hypothetical protein [Aureibacter tunicatorum]|nr:hypothetical protein [Aureibacter tunicatorum]
MISNRIDEMKSKSFPSNEQDKQGTPDKIENGDEIIGIWEMENDYYAAIYEIVKYKGKYYGKIHYYNDGKEEYIAKGSKDDYFMEGITFQNGKYSTAKMYMPDGSYYEANIRLNGNELSVSMTIQGEAYKEIWKRKKPE